MSQTPTGVNPPTVTPIPPAFVGNDKLIAGMVLGVLTFWLFYQAMFNVVPDIQRDLNMPDSSLNAVISLGSLFSGCFIILMGSLADKFGRVRFTFIGLILNIIGCICLYFSTDAITFGIGRVFQGLAAACVMPATLSLVKYYYHGASRQRAFSLWSLGSFGGSGLSSIVGGAIATYLGWKSIFILSIIVSITAMALIKGTPESKSTEVSHSRYDYVGLFSCVLGLLSLNLLITKGLKLGFSDSFTLTMLAGAVVMGTIFFVSQTRRKIDAFVDFKLFKNKGYSGACLSNFLLNCGAGTIIVVNTYLQKGHGLTAFQAGLKSLGYVAMVIIMIRVGEKLLQRMGYKNPMVIGALTTALGIFLASLTFVSHDTYMWLIIVAFAVFGFGLGCYATPAADCAMVNAPMEKAGMAAGVFKMASALGASFGIALGATIFSTFAKDAGVHVAAQYALWLMICFVTLSAVVVWMLVPSQKEAVFS